MQEEALTTSTLILSYRIFRYYFHCDYENFAILNVFDLYFMQPYLS